MSARLGYVVIERRRDTGKLSFDWDGGEIFDTSEAAADEAAEATRTMGAQMFEYRVAELTLVEKDASC